MIYIILIILICIYIAAARLIPISFAVLGILVGIWILTGIFCAIAESKFKKVKYTDTMKKKLQDAEDEDIRADIIATANLKAREEEIRSTEKSELAPLEKQIAEAQLNIVVSETILKEMDVLAQDDLNLDTVDALIKLIEGRRAESIPEALRLYDARKTAEYNERVRRQAEEFRRNMDAMHARQREEREREQYWENWAHQRKIEMLEAQKLRELEQIRKDQEEFLRK